MQMRSQLAQLQTERQSWQQRVQTLEQQIAQQQTDRHDLTQQLDQAKNELARLEQQLAQTPSPTNILSFSLFPISRLRSEGDKPKLITIPAGTPSVKLDLIFEPEDEFASYRVELRRRGEEQVLQRWDRRRAQSTNRGSTITINVPGKLLPAGDYRVTLTGIGVDGSSDAIADYDFKSLIRQ
jgi:DNA repair exonuclease SbcCD ATPase subunit